MITEWPTGVKARAVVVAVVSFLAGVSTSFAQGLLPDAVVSFANSASGWTGVTVLLLAWARVHTPIAAALGAASFSLLTLGYSAAAELRHLHYDPTLFVLVGLVVGPLVGVATSWLRTESLWRAASGTALLSGIGFGEAAYGLTVVGDTTSPVYWTLVGVAGAALLLAMLVRRIHGLGWGLRTVAGTGAVAGAFVLAYSALVGV